MNRAILAMGVAIAAAGPAAAQTLQPGENRVSFTHEGDTLVGRLYLPAEYRPGVRLPTVVVVGPWTTVKEQVSARYARRLSEQGFAALAFDFRGFGESGGSPRQWESQSRKVSDIGAAAGFALSLASTDPQALGGLAVCFGAGQMAHAIAGGAPFRSFATVAAWLHDAPTLQAVFGAEEIERRFQVGRAAADLFRRTGQVEYVPAASATDRTAAMFDVDFYNRADRGVVPEWTNQFAVMGWTEWLALDGLAVAPRVTVPTLMVHSEGSALPDNVRRFHATLAGPRSLLWLEGEHTEFYDHEAKVSAAAAAVGDHFRATLGTASTPAVAAAAPAAPADADALRETNRRGVEEFFRALEAMDISRFLAVWDEAGVQEMPFSPEGFPKRLDGREAIHRQYAGLPDSYTGMRFPREVQPTLSPNQFVVRYTGEIGLKAGGRYDNTYIGHFTMKDGKVVRFVEYFDPLVLRNAFGDALQRNFGVDGGR